MASKRVLIVGVGGLGVPAAITLARARTAKIALMDAEAVELSNLPRQVIYRTSDLGRRKVEAAARSLRHQFPQATIECLDRELSPSNARKSIEESDFVIDGTDDPVAKFLINDTCIAAKRPFAYGGVLGLRGQLMTVLPRRTACLRCLFEEPPLEAEVASCRDAGIIGSIAGVIGTLQAREATVFFLGKTPELAGRVLTYDATGVSRIRITQVRPRPGCICGAAAFEQTAAPPGTIDGAGAAKEGL